MDPNANLDEQLRIVHAAIAGTATLTDFERLADLVEALDHWITGGGFIPDRWNRPGTPGGLYVGKDRD